MLSSRYGFSDDTTLLTARYRFIMLVSVCEPSSFLGVITEWKASFSGVTSARTARNFLVDDCCGWILVPWGDEDVDGVEENFAISPLHPPIFSDEVDLASPLFRRRGGMHRARYARATQFYGCGVQ
uniref:Uncharacterized protein n=1 Tax=Morchella brunnea TaxID=1174671 RepID=A0A8K1I7U9_9PEZI|nr:hypothetical protein LK370_mgp132 [Morchella brunnea]UBU98444.1 hypothetical protein [Morchella brunnea]